MRVVVLHDQQGRRTEDSPRTNNLSLGHHPGAVRRRPAPVVPTMYQAAGGELQDDDRVTLRPLWATL